MAEFDSFKAPKIKRGRPTKYHPDFNQIAFRACLNGATDEELAERFNIDKTTLYWWQKRHPEFRSSIVSGKIEADDKVAEALYKTATGYQHPETKVLVVNGEIETVQVTKHYEPNFNSMRLWLLNRQRSKWRDNSDMTVHRGANEMSDEELERIARGENANATGSGSENNRETESET